MNNRRCAIKALSLEQVHDREAIASLKHEYEVAKDFDNPHVIQAHEFGTDRGRVYLVLDLFAGPNLKQALRIEAERIPYLTPKIIADAADGLNYLHQQGWVHRDIKPDNFLVNQQGEVKLIDFAIAQRVRRGLARLKQAGPKSKAPAAICLPNRFVGNGWIRVPIFTVSAVCCTNWSRDGCRTRASARTSC